MPQFYYMKDYDVKIREDESKCSASVSNERIIISYVHAIQTQTVRCDVFGIFHNRTKICWTSITGRIFLLQPVISLRHPGIRSKTKFDISVDDEARRGCEDRVGEGKSNNPYIGTEQFIGEDFVRDCIRFNRAIRLSSRISRLCGRLRDSRMIGEFKIQRGERAVRRARARMEQIMLRNFIPPLKIPVFAERLKWIRDRGCE